MHLRLLAAALAAVLVVLGPGRVARGPALDGVTSPAPAGADHGPAPAGEVKEFHLYATDGWLTLPDGERAYIWGFSDRNEKGSATLPGPAITVNEGDQVRITLHNIGPAEPGAARPNHTIHLHGLDVDQANDGVGHTSREVPLGESQTYEFTANRAGTHWYHCHVDPTEHIQMGMYGPIIVQATGGSKEAWTGGPAFDRQVTLVLSEIDPVWHTSVHGRKPYDRTLFHPRYWLINGKAAPDAMYDLASAIHGEVGERILVRLINAGYQWHAMHMHGFHFEVIASDGRPMPYAWEKDTLSIAPAERYDLLVTLDQKGVYPFHDHSEVRVTNNGALHGGTGGMHTMVYAGVPVPKGPDRHGSHGGQPAAQPGGLTGAHGAPSAPAAGEVTVILRGSTFQPAVLEVKAGSTVTWVNQDFRTTHTVEGDGWASPTLSYGMTYSRQFPAPGTYEIWCGQHPTMVSQILVTE